MREREKRERERERLSHSMGMKVPRRDFFFFFNLQCLES